MPVQECQLNGNAGFRWGKAGTCYTHDGTDAGKARAKKLAVKQAIAIGGGTIKNELDSDGLRLFEDGMAPLSLKLLSSTAFQTGVLHLVYGPDPHPPTGGYDEAKETLPQD